MLLSKKLWSLNHTKNSKGRRPSLIFYITPYLYKIKNFTAKIEFRIEKDQYVIKTATDYKDIEKVLKLRHEVFYTELLKKNLITGIDVDKFDFICDHLMVEDKNTGELIGTYRLNSSLFSSNFYSETEFDISNILKLPGIKLELGRACIHKEHRNGITIALLWSGLSEYIKLTETDYLFGCSSIKTTSLNEIVYIEKYLQTYHYAPESLRVIPKKKFKIKNLQKKVESLKEYDSKEARKMIPSLLKSYIKTGALICGEPALDKDFECIDCFTLLYVSQMNKIVKNKFQI